MSFADLRHRPPCPMPLQRIGTGRDRSAGRSTRLLRPLLAAVLLAATSLAWPAAWSSALHAAEELPSTVAGDFAADPDSSLALALARIEGEALDLEGALDAALRNATTVRIAEASLAATAAVVRREQGRFDPELFADLDYLDQETPSSSPFAGASVLSTQNLRTQSGARVRLPFGTELSAQLETVRRETNSSFTVLNPEYVSLGFVQIRQPLLAGLGAGSRFPLAAAERAQEAATAGLEDARGAVAATVRSLYWDLYAAERDLAVQLLIVDQAAALLREAQVRARAGLVGPSEVANAEVFLAEQQLALLDREQLMDTLSDALASLMDRRPGGGESRYRPVDAPPSDLPSALADTLVAEAVERSPALHALRLELALLGALEDGAARNALPELDLVATLGGNGLGGEAQPVVFGGDTLRTTVDGSFGDALEQVLARDYGRWSIGASFTWPLGRHAGQGERDRLRAEMVRQEQRIRTVALSLEEDIRASWRELENGQSRLEAARRGVRASTEQVRIGLLEFRNGRSTAFELVRLGADLAAAQQRYSQALVRSAKAAAQLAYLTAGAYPPR